MAHDTVVLAYCNLVAGRDGIPGASAAWKPEVAAWREHPEPDARTADEEHSIFGWWIRLVLLLKLFDGRFPAAMWIFLLRFFLSHPGW